MWVRLAFALLAAAAASGCVESTLLMKVRADGSGHVTLRTRLYLAGLRAIDTMFAGDPMGARRPPQIAEELPAPSPGALEEVLGAPVTVVSTRLDAAPDGGVRTTEIEFADVRRLQLVFPPVAALPGSGAFGSSTIQEKPVITFALRPHDDGDAILVLKLPDPRMTNDPQGPVTTFQTDSPQERLFKQAIAHMALRLFVETEQPLLRTNAPRREGNQATIVDLDLDRMINAMDETRARRLVAPGSFQEMLWQLGDLPGAIVPVDHEIFLEFEPAGQPRSSPPPTVQAPPDTEIYLAPLKTANGGIRVGAPANITNHPGYDNQPFFTPDGGILFTSMRSAPGRRDDPGASQTDIFRYDLASRAITRLTETPESEYSPTTMPDGERISVVRVEADGTQRLARISRAGSASTVDLLLPDVKPVGYHAWADEHTLALFILGANGAPATLQLADLRTGQARVVATDIGRSVLRMPGTGASRHISFVQRERSGDRVNLVAKEFDSATGAISTLTNAVEGSTEADLAWMPDGTLLMVAGDVLYAWRRGQSGWRDVASLAGLGLHGVSRLAVSPTGEWLALVGLPPQGR